jgi:hypothetical protein
MGPKQALEKLAELLVRLSGTYPAETYVHKKQTQNQGCQIFLGATYQNREK